MGVSKQSSLKPSMQNAIKLYSTIIKDPNESGYYIYNYKDAFDMFNKLSKDKKGVIEHYLYKCYVYGHGTPIDYGKAMDNLIESCNKGYWNAFLDLAIIKIKQNLFSNYTNSISNEITSYLQNALLNAETDSQKTEVKFNILIHLLNTYNNEKEPSSAVKKRYQTQIFKALFELIDVNKYERAFFLSAIILNTPSYYHNLGNDYSKYCKNPYYNNIEHQFLKAAEYGEMRSSKYLAIIYYNQKKYTEMTWWYWWSIYYNKDDTNKEIEDEIKKDKELKKMYLQDLKNTLKEYNTENNVYKTRDENMKEHFKKMYYKEKIEEYFRKQNR
jgi:hypothetical protein